MNIWAVPVYTVLLSQSIGTVAFSTTLKRDCLSEAELAPAVVGMTTPNAAAARAMLAVGVRAATDVTGFGLLGHLSSLLEASGVAGEITAPAVPLLPRARDAATRGAIPGGSQRNLASLAETTTFGGGVDEIDRKSTRLNSSHGYISYAVFCLKKK